jgi:hypothetical protein
MTTHTVLVVPVEVEQPCVLYDLQEGDEGGADLERLVHDGKLDAIDFGVYLRHRFQYAVGDYALVDGSPINTRAIRVVREVTGLPNAVQHGIAGTCVFLGCTEYGDYADVPESVLIAAGVK